MVHSSFITPGLERRYRWLLEASIQAFGQVGYQRCQIADIAREARVALGTVYRYAESKQALFDAAVRLGFGHEEAAKPTAFPIPDPEPDATLTFLRSALLAIRERLTLRNLLARTQPSTIGSEVATVVGELYDTLAENRGGIRMVDRSSREWPELAGLFFREVRDPGILELETYLRGHMSSGALAPVPDVPAAARQILEMCAWMAVHRAWTPDQDVVRDEQARASVLHFTLRTLLADSNERTLPTS